MAQTVDAEIAELYADWAASKSSDADNYTQAKINQITAQKNALTMDNASDDSDYDGTVSGLQTEISDAQAIIDNTSGTETTSSIAAAQLDKTDAQEALDYIQDTFTADNFSYVAFRQAELDIIINNLNAELSASGDVETNQNMQTELAFLNAKKASLNTDPVDVIQVDDLFAATGNVLLYADTLAGSSTGNIISQKDVEVTVRNDSVNPLEILNVYIPDDPGGSIYFNEQVIESAGDAASLNTDSSATTAFSMTSDHGNFNPVVSITNRFNARSSTYNPTLSTSIKSPEMLLSDNITNTGGRVVVSNKYGSVFQSATINAAELRLTSGGALFISNKGNGVNNMGPHPTAAFSSYVDPRENSPGQGTSASSTGGCNAVTLPCTVNNVTQDNQSSYTIAGGKIFISANTVNLNGLIQSGVAQKSITIGSISDPWTAFRSQIDLNGNNTLDADEWTDRNGNGSFDLEDLQGTYIVDASADNGTFSGTNTTREVTGLFDAEYDADEDVVKVSGFEASGGEVFIAGKLISTGKGQINVMDGYTTYNITNNSGKDIKIDTIDAGEVEGKITLIDNFKLNSDNLSYVTQYTRIGNDIKVHTGYGAATTDSSSSFTKTNDANGQQRLTNYTPKDGARYYWMSGEEVDYTKIYRTRETTWGGWFGINFYTSTSFTPHDDDLQSTLIDPESLPKADYAAIDTSIGDQYRFRKRFEEHSYAVSLASGYGDNPDVSCKNYVFVKKCTTTVYNQVDQEGNLYYYHDVTADRPVDIRFIGSDTGSVTITSNAGIQLNGSIKNRTGTTTLTASDGIDVLNDSALLDTANLALTASGGSIGSADNVLKITQTSGSTISATADTGVFMRNENDNMSFTTLANNSGNIDLWAGKSITLNTGTTALQGDNITLYSQYGSIADSSGNAIRLNTLTNGILNVRSRDGGIKLSETSGDLYIEQIDVTGNAEISTASGSILDANLLQTNDEATQAALLGLWEELGLTGDNATAKRDAQIDSFEESQEALYEDYYALRNVSIDDNGTASYDDYDENYEYTLTAGEQENLQSNRFAEEMTTLYNSYWELRNVQQTSDGTYIAEAYDPNFVYNATEEEREALDNDAAAIADFEAEKIADYQQGHTRFGSGTYTPGYEYVVVQSDIDGFAADYAAAEIQTFKAEREARYAAGYAAFGDAGYVDNFTYSADAAELADMTAGYVWDEEYLEAPLPGQSFKEVTDSTAFIETANIIADNITLNIVGGNIGTFTDTATFSLTDVQDGTLDNASKIKLMAAEADDVELNQSTNMVLLTQREDIDIKTRKSDSVVQINVPDGYAFVGGETSLNIQSVSADGEIRLKVNGDILNIRGDTNAAVTSDALVLEAATGSIGTSTNPMYLDVRDNYKMTARAAEGLWITEKTGNMQIGQIYSPETVVLTSPDQILDIDMDGITDVKGDIVNLIAANGIGTAPTSSDNRSVEVQKALEIQTVSTDNSTFTLDITNGGGYFYIEKGKFVRLTETNQTDDLIVGMGTGSTLYGTGTYTTGTDNITIWGGSGGMSLDMTGGLNVAGADVTLISGGNIDVSGALNTVGGDLDATAIDNISFDSTAAIDTDAGTVLYAAGAGITQAGSITTDNASVSFYGGDNRTAGRAAHVVSSGTITTGGAAVIMQAGDNSSFGGDYWVQQAELTQSGTITTSGGAITMTSKQDLTQSGSLSSAGADIILQAGDTNVALDNATLTQSGTLASAGGAVLMSATTSGVQSGTITTSGGTFTMLAGDNITRFDGTSLTQSGSISTSGGTVQLTSTKNLTQSGTVDTDGGALSLDAGETDMQLADATLVQSGTATTNGGAVVMSATKAATQSGTITTSGGDVTIFVGDNITDFANTLLTQSGTITTAGGDVSLRTTYDSLFSGSLTTDAGMLTSYAGRNTDSADSLAISTNNADVRFAVVDNLTLAGTLATAGGDLTLNANTQGVGQQIRINDKSRFSTSGGDVTILSAAGLQQDLTIEDNATINAATGRFNFNLSGEATVTGLTTTNATDNATLIVARTIQDGGDTFADLTINSNGDLDLRAFKYINLNKIDYNGSDPLGLNITSANGIASTAGAVLDIDAEAGIRIDKLYARNSSITAGLSSLLTIADGQVNNNLYMNIGDFDARIGRLEDNSLVPASWVEDGDNSDFFVSASATTGVRAEDYRCTGGPSYIGNGNAVLNFNFSFNDPHVDCSGTLAFYRNPYVLVSPVQTVEQRLDTVLNNILTQNMQILQDSQIQPLVGESIAATNTASANIAAQALIVDDAVAISPAAAAAPAQSRIGNFALRASSSLGAIGVSPTNFINLALPVELPAQNDNEEPVADEGTDEDDGAQPLANSDADDETDGDDTGAQPLAGTPTAIGPLSLLQ